MRAPSDLRRLMPLPTWARSVDPCEAAWPNSPKSGRWRVNWANDHAMTVVLAANGYPEAPDKGGSIDLGNAEASGAEAGGAKVFHAGTKLADGALTANGGRVLNVTATGPNVTAAQEAAYRAVDAINFPTGFCRRDIGQKEVAREAERAK